MPRAPTPNPFRLERLNESLPSPAGPAAARRAWADALINFEDTPKQLLKDDGPVRVWRANLLGHPVAIKRWALRRLSDRLKWKLRMSRGHRHWRNAQWLLAHDIPTARPFALLASRRDAESHHPALWLIMQWLPGPTVLEQLAAAQATPELARALGRQLAHMVNSGRYNRDHKPSNLIVLQPPAPAPPPASPALRLAPPPDPGPLIAVIDCVAIRRHHPAAAEHAAARMLASLMIEPTGVGHPPAPAWLDQVADACATDWLPAAPDSAALAHRLADRARDLIRRHPDPTPRINPLA